jgi:hypothetical protein
MNKNFVIIALLIALVSVTIYSFPAIQTTKNFSQLGLHSTVCIYKNNELTAPCTHNTMMNSGLNWTRDLIGNAAASGTINYIAVGNTTTAETATSTTLPGEITDCSLGRATGTYTVQTVSQGNWSISKVFTSNCANAEVVNTTGLFNASSSGTMFAGKNFAASVTLQNGDQLNVTWYVWVS